MAKTTTTQHAQNQRVADSSPAYKAAVDAYAIVAQFEGDVPEALMAAMWRLVTAEYHRAVVGMS